MDPEEIKRIRKKLNITQAELAEKLGVSRRTVENMEQYRGTRKYAEKIRKMGKE